MLMVEFQSYNQSSTPFTRASFQTPASPVPLPPCLLLWQATLYLSIYFFLSFPFLFSHLQKPSPHTNNLEALEEPQNLPLVSGPKDRGTGSLPGVSNAEPETRFPVKPSLGAEPWKFLVCGWWGSEQAVLSLGIEVLHTSGISVGCFSPGRTNPAPGSSSPALWPWA